MFFILSDFSLIQLYHYELMIFHYFKNFEVSLYSLKESITGIE